jgi:hypothetical protein
MYILTGCVLQASIKERKAFSGPTILTKMHQKVLQEIRLESLNHFDLLLNIGQASKKLAAVIVMHFCGRIGNACPSFLDVSVCSSLTFGNKTAPPIL